MWPCLLRLNEVLVGLQKVSLTFILHVFIYYVSLYFYFLGCVLFIKYNILYVYLLLLLFLFDIHINSLVNSKTSSINTNYFP